jgi:hypothetical protein
MQATHAWPVGINGAEAFAVAGRREEFADILTSFSFLKCESRNRHGVVRRQAEYFEKIGDRCKSKNLLE